MPPSRNTLVFERRCIPAFALLAYPEGEGGAADVEEILAAAHVKAHHALGARDPASGSGPGPATLLGMTKLAPRDLQAEVAKHFQGTPEERVRLALELGRRTLEIFMATLPPGTSRRQARHRQILNR